MRALVLRVAASVMLVAAAGAQTAPGSFRFERSVTPAGPGPSTLAMDVPLLAGPQPIDELQIARSAQRVIAQGGPADLRFFDRNGREVAFLYVAPPPVQPVWLAGNVLPAPTTEKTSGFDADFGSVALIDRVRVQGISAPFLKRAVLEGSGDREHWTVLAPEATLFDLPAEDLRRLEVEFAAGEFRYLRITWDDTNSGRVAPPATVNARRVPVAAAGPLLRTAVTFERRGSEPGRSRFRLRLPGRHLPIARLDVDIDQPNVMRRATITEARFTNGELQPFAIGGAMLKRVTREGVHADELSIPIQMPRGADLDLVTEDQNNPPLSLRSVTAVFAELPIIYFESDGGPLTARYGNSTISQPRYDLEAVRESIAIEKARPATWSEPVMNETGAASAPPMPPTGTTLDARLFRHARDVPSGEAGLVAVPLDAAVLAHRTSATRFADVRVLDGSGRQIPYVVERRDEPLRLVLEAVRLAEPPGEAKADPGRTWYSLKLPFEQLPSARLTLETSARVFRRRVSLVLEQEADARRRTDRFATVTSAEWMHAESETPAPSLQLAVPARAGREIFLMIDEGDNAPLSLERPALLLPSYRIRFYRPDGAQLSLVYGRDDLGPPEYDLELVARQVLDDSANELAAGPERGSDAARSPAFISPPVFWTILGFALAVLLGIIFKLIRSEPLKT
jgi:Protein of unknown function (DUF3999)